MYGRGDQGHPHLRHLGRQCEGGSWYGENPSHLIIIRRNSRYPSPVGGASCQVRGEARRPNLFHGLRYQLYNASGLPRDRMLDHQRPIESLFVDLWESEFRCHYSSFQTQQCPSSGAGHPRGHCRGTTTNPPPLEEDLGGRRRIV